jgi:hypothetical protein
LRSIAGIKDKKCSNHWADDFFEYGYHGDCFPCTSAGMVTQLAIVGWSDGGHSIASEKGLHPLRIFQDRLKYLFGELAIGISNKRALTHETAQRDAAIIIMVVDQC